MTDAPASTERSGLIALAVIACPIVVALAVILELVSSQYTNSPTASWGELVPIAWPQPARVAYWLGVAAAAAGFRWGLRQIGARPRPILTFFTVAPFVTFALGIAASQPWATWH